MKTQTSDFQHRQQAVSELDHNVVVMAGAGTGKTTLLIDRLMLMLLGEKISIDRIVALTFTKKAAEEMRERLESKLRAVQKGENPSDILIDKYGHLKDEWPALCEQALAQMPKAQITTIHSFAGTLLRLYPIQSRIDPNFREDDGTLAEPLFDVLWSRWLAGDLSAQSKNKKFWIQLLALADLEDLKKLARELSFSAVDADPHQPDVDLKPFCRVWLDEWQAILETYPLPDQAKSFSPGARAIESTLSSVMKGEALSSSDFECLDNMPSKMPKSWGEDPLLQKAVNRMAARALALHQVDEAFIKKVLKLLMPFLSQLKAELNRQGIVQHDQVLFQTRNLLRDHVDVRSSLKKKYATFLIDEFQDTDPLQGEILFYLAEKATLAAGDWRSVQLESGRLFVVGDPKQSIYRFRGADIGAFDEFKQIMLKQGAVELSLTSNFRSQSTILSTVNHMFSQVMKPTPYVQPEFVALDPTRETKEMFVDILHLTYENQEEKIKAEPSLEYEAHLIGEWIQKNVGQVLNGKEVHYRDVALLFRTSTPFPIFTEALRNRGIPFLVEGEKTFYRRPEIVEFLNLLSCLANPADELAFAGVLRSPLGALTDTELMLLKKAGPLDYRKAPPLLEKKLNDFYAVLQDLQAKAMYVSVPDYLSEIFQRTWLLELASRMRHGEQAVANLLKIRQLANEWSDAAPLTLASFVQRLDEYRDDEKDEGENPLSDAQYDAVKVMTIHKSKGLEFPVVFLPNLAGKSGRHQNRPISLRDWRRGWTGLCFPGANKMNAAMLILDDENKNHEEAEEVRVFYVATTRAREKLVLLTRAGESGSSEAMGYLSATNLLTADQPHLQFSPTEWQAVVVAEQKNKILEAWPAEFTSQVLAEAFTQRELEFENLKNQTLFTSPSRVMHEVEKEYFVDEESALIRSNAIMVGLLCHKVLEEWDFSIAEKTISVAVELLLQRAARLFEVLPGKDSEPILADARATLLSFFKSDAYKKLTQSKIVAREIPFFFPLQDGNSAVMRGVIDVLYEFDGKLIIGDYKTNRVTSDSIQKTAQSYQAQGDIYRQVIEKTLGKKAGFELLFLRTGEAVNL